MEAAKERIQGFYWVKYRGEWTIGRLMRTLKAAPDGTLIYDTWVIMGLERFLTHESIEEIGEIIERQKHTPQDY